MKLTGSQYPSCVECSHHIVYYEMLVIILIFVTLYAIILFPLIAFKISSLLLFPGIYDMLLCVFLCNCPQIRKILIIIHSKFVPHSPLPFWDSNYVYIRLLDILPPFTDICFSSVFFLSLCFNLVSFFSLSSSSLDLFFSSV